MAPDDKQKAKNHTKAATSPRGTLGTFAGVFTPSILTILFKFRLRSGVRAANHQGTLLALF